MKYQSTAFIHIVFGLSMLLSTAAAAQEHAPATSATAVATPSEEAYLAQQKTIRKHAPVHSATQLAAYLARAKQDPSSAINGLSPAARARFIDSLRFNETGVTSLYYTDIESELTACQALDLLSVFGLQSTLAFMPKLRVRTPEDQAVIQAFGKGNALSTRKCGPITNNTGVRAARPVQASPVRSA